MEKHKLLTFKLFSNLKYGQRDQTWYECENTDRGLIHSFKNPSKTPPSNDNNNNNNNNNTNVYIVGPQSSTPLSSRFTDHI